MSTRPTAPCRRRLRVNARPMLILGLAGIAIATLPPSASAQRRQIDRQIRDNRQRLEDIRRERSELEAELRGLRGRARDITSELGIIDQKESPVLSVSASWRPDRRVQDTPLNVNRDGVGLDPSHRARGVHRFIEIHGTSRLSVGHEN